MEQVRVRLEEGGRLDIPAPFREALGLHTGDELILRLEAGEMRLLTVHHAIRAAQERVREYVAEGRSLSDELLAERRAEA